MPQVEGLSRILEKVGKTEGVCLAQANSEGQGAAGGGVPLAPTLSKPPPIPHLKFDLGPRSAS